jgi:phosphonate transport system ATP-binding protein
MAAAISVSDLTKNFNCCRALDRVDLQVEPGEMVALIGASGSGKSTLLRLIAGLATGDRAHGASAIHVHGRKVQAQGRLAGNIRDIRSQIGFVFQRFNLVERLPVITNVLAGMLYRVPAWRSTIQFFTREEIRLGLEALGRVGIADRAMQRASTLSGGQQQRAAIARTLVQKAGVILADEPIASLDPKSSRKVMDALAKINREDGTTVLVSLHQVDVALRYCPRTVALHHGRVVYDGASAALTPKLLHELYGAEADDVLLTNDPDKLEFVHRPRGANVDSQIVDPQVAAGAALVQASLAESRAEIFSNTFPQERCNENVQ